ncbi:hypothetical protein [Flectobacillus major]|jgi:hypothetical protein|uniref:hypothetical protein n=1 Tax=Flectobacillus major TaxID=103 RepID=UPI00040CC2A8|nr:hypothetical protein [Flectobacillus major]
MNIFSQVDLKHFKTDVISRINTLFEEESKRPVPPIPFVSPAYKVNISKANSFQQEGIYNLSIQKV